MPAEHLMNSANFLLWAPISCEVLPLLRNSFKVHQLFRSALKFMVRLFAYVYYPISCRIHWAQGQLLKKDKGRRDLCMNSSNTQCQTCWVAEWVKKALSSWMNCVTIDYHCHFQHLLLCTWPWLSVWCLCVQWTGCSRTCHLTHISSVLSNHLLLVLSGWVQCEDRTSGSDMYHSSFSN